MKLTTTDRRRALGLVGILLVGLVPVSVGNPAVEAAEWAPTPPPTIYPVNAGPDAVRRRDFIVDVCTTQSQLDCVESIAAFIEDAWVEGTSTSTVGNDANGQPANRNWTIPGITALDGQTDLTVTHLVNYTGNLFLQTSIASSGADGDRDANSLPRDTKFRATVRTSWVLPTHVSGKMTDAKTTVEKLATSGASKITMEGTPLVYMVISDDASLTDPAGKGDYEVRNFSMTVSDGRFYPIKQACIEKPAIMTSENGYGHPLPSFNNGKLDLKITAPHFRSNGTTEHLGIYEANVPMEMAKCLWGSTVSKDSSFDIQVFETEGTAKVSTNSVEVTDDAVVIRASGFTFSSPTVRVAYTAPTTTSSSSSSSSSSTTSSSTSSSSTSSSTTSTVSMPAKPAKPAAVKIVGGKSGASISFARVRGVAYSVVATKGAARKTIRCAQSSSKVTCKATALSRGQWKITITPRVGSTLGTVHSARLQIK